jgi:NADH-quinone oxidoreductase E subunit
MNTLIKRPALEGGALLTALHILNEQFGYLPEEELRRVADELDVPLSQLYSAATFYAAFHFEPQGRHTIQVCAGTACYIRGSGKLLEKLNATLGVQPGETTADGDFTLQTVRCVGSCSMAPVMRVDGDTYGRLKTSRLERILDRHRKGAEATGEEQEP